MVNKVESKDWFAWINMMPTGIPTLHVTGLIDLKNQSESACLEYDSLEKRMPPNLILRVNTKPIFVPRDEDDKYIRLHYSQSASMGQFDNIIIILPDGNTHKISTIDVVY